MSTIGPTRFQQAVLRFRGHCNIVNAGGRGSGKSFCMMLDLIDHCRDFGPDELAKLLPVLGEAETAVEQLERRGHTLDAFLHKAKDGALPSYHVRFAGKEFWFHTPAEVEAFRVAESQKLGKELVLVTELATADATAPQAPAAVAAMAPERYTQDDWHEVRVLNRVVAKLKELGFEPSKRQVVRACVDWTERVPHLAGAAGAHLCEVFFARGWVRRIGTTRAVVLTPAGEQGWRELGLS